MKSILYNIFLFSILFPVSVLATTPLEGLNQAGQGTGLITNKEPSAMVALVINALLGLLGTAFVVFIILGGFKWMTSRGNSERVEEAKKTIISATIGLAIVVSSYIIVRFVILALLGATDGGGPPAEGGG